MAHGTLRRREAFVAPYVRGTLLVLAEEPDVQQAPVFDICSQVRARAINGTPRTTIFPGILFDVPGTGYISVSYTHLTLPTIYSV